MIVIAVVLPTAAIVITYLFVLEVIKYRSGTMMISPRRFRLRFAAWVLSLLLCATVGAGLFVLPRSLAQGHPGVVLGVWGLGLAMAVALIWIMLADIQEVEDRVKDREREIWRDFARLLASAGEKRDRENEEPPQT